MGVLSLPPLGLAEERVEGCWGTSLALGSGAELATHDCGHKAALHQLEFVRIYAQMWNASYAVEPALWSNASQHHRHGSTPARRHHGR